METCDEIANMLTKCGGLDGGRGQGAYLYMIDLHVALVESGQKKVTIIQLIPCYSAFLKEKLIKMKRGLVLTFFLCLPAPTFSIKSQMIALLKYSIVVHSIPCKANATFIFYTHFSKRNSVNSEILTSSPYFSHHVETLTVN